MVVVVVVVVAAAMTEVAGVARMTICIQTVARGNEAAHDLTQGA